MSTSYLTLVENLRWKLSADRIKTRHCLYYITTDPHLGERVLEKSFVKILNNLENEHQGCPINIAEENDVTGLEIKNLKF